MGVMTADFVFSGTITCESFVDFARHRAGRLDLSLNISACSEAAVALSVSGQEDLVDMFEMACSLGPHDCIIYDISRVEPYPAPENTGVVYKGEADGGQ